MSDLSRLQMVLARYTGDNRAATTVVLAFDDGAVFVVRGGRCPGEVFAGFTTAEVRIQDV